MWYEALIPASLSVFFVTLPDVFIPWWCEFWHGNRWHPKNVEDEVVEHFHFRDLLRSGDPWRPFGVEHIPDEVPEFK